MIAGRRSHAGLPLGVLLALAAPSFAQDPPAATVELRLTVRDVSGSLVPSSSVKVFVNGDEVALAGGGAGSIVNVPAATAEVVLEPSDSDGFWRRQVRLLAGSRSARSSRCLYVAPKPTNFTIPYVSRSVPWLDGGLADRGLAHLEPAFLEDPALGAGGRFGEYEAILHYNYARALQQTCLSESYDTCASARSLLKSILASIDNDSEKASRYLGAKVTRSMVADALADIDRKEAAETYRTATAAVQARDLEAARASFAKVEAGLAESPEVYRSIGVNAARLQADLGYVSTLSALH